MSPAARASSARGDCAGREASSAEDGIRKWASGFLVERREQRLKPAAAQLSNSKGSPALKPSTPRATGESQGYGADMPSLSSPSLQDRKGTEDRPPSLISGAACGAASPLASLCCRWEAEQTTPAKPSELVQTTQKFKPRKRWLPGAWSAGLALSVPRGLRPASQLIRTPENH